MKCIQKDVLINDVLKGVLLNYLLKMDSLIGLIAKGIFKNGFVKGSMNEFITCGGLARVFLKDYLSVSFMGRSLTRIHLTCALEHISMRISLRRICISKVSLKISS